MFQISVTAKRGKVAVNQMSKQHNVEPVLPLEKYLWFFVTESSFIISTTVHDLFIFKAEVLTKWQIGLICALKISQKKIHLYV